MIETALKILRQKSKICDLADYNLPKLIEKLEANLRCSITPGVGLSAIQIGIPIKVAIVRTQTLKINLYNSEILKMSGMSQQTEGCLSLPNTYRKMMRAERITIRNGDGLTYHMKGFDATVVQHEMDHWDGKLIIDKANLSSEGAI